MYQSISDHNSIICDYNLLHINATIFFVFINQPFRQTFDDIYYYLLSDTITGIQTSL